MRNLPRLNKKKSNSNITPLKSGEGGTFQTLQALIDIHHEQKINPDIRKYALKIIHEKGIKEHHYLDQARAIGEHVQQNYNYVRDPKNNELVITPLEAIQNIENGNFYGDCEDMSLLIATLISSIGGNPYFTIVKYNKNAKGFQHIYITVRDRNLLSKIRPLAIDAIRSDKPIGYEPKSQVKKYIKIN